MIGLEYILLTTRFPQTELANLLGIKKQNLTLWLKGKQPISKKHLPTLSKLFKLPQHCFQKELSEQEKLDIQIIKSEQRLDSSCIEIEDEVYDPVTKEFVTVPFEHYDAGELEYLTRLRLERRIVELKQRLTSCIRNVEKQGFDPDNQFSDYNSYLEDNIRLIDRMIDVADRADLAPHFLRHVLKAIELLNRDDVKLENEHETTKQIYAVLEKCYQEEKAHTNEVIGEQNRMLKLIDELADDDLY